MPDEAFATTNDPTELAELDFEHEDGGAPKPIASQPAAPAQPAAGHDSDAFWESMAANTDPETGVLEQEAAAEPQGGMDEAAALEYLQELADEDPFAAANVMAEIRAQQIQVELDRRLEPLFQREANLQANEIVSKIQQEFPGVTEEELAHAVEQHLELFEVEPAMQLERLRDRAELISLRKRAAYERGDDVIAGMDATVQSADRFGAQRGSAAQPSPQQRETQGRFAPGRVQRTVHVEGGSGPQLPAPPPVDPVIAELEASEVGSDIFGRRGR